MRPVNPAPWPRRPGRFGPLKPVWGLTLPWHPRLRYSRSGKKVQFGTVPSVWRNHWGKRPNSCNPLQLADRKVQLGPSETSSYGHCRLFRTPPVGTSLTARHTWIRARCSRALPSRAARARALLAGDAPRDGTQGGTRAPRMARALGPPGPCPRARARRRERPPPRAPRAPRAHPRPHGARARASVVHTPPRIARNDGANGKQARRPRHPRRTQDHRGTTIGCTRRSPGTAVEDGADTERSRSHGTDAL